MILISVEYTCQLKWSSGSLGFSLFFIEDSIRLLGFDNKWVCIEDSIRLLLRNGFVISHLLDGNEMGSDQNSL